MAKIFDCSFSNPGGSKNGDGGGLISRQSCDFISCQNAVKMMTELTPMYPVTYSTDVALEVHQPGPGKLFYKPSCLVAGLCSCIAFMVVTPVVVTSLGQQELWSPSSSMSHATQHLQTSQGTIRLTPITSFLGAKLRKETPQRPSSSTKTHVEFQQIVHALETSKMSTIEVATCRNRIVPGRGSHESRNLAFGGGFEMAVCKHK